MQLKTLVSRRYDAMLNYSVNPAFEMLINPVPSNHHEMHADSLAFREDFRGDG